MSAEVPLELRAPPAQGFRQELTLSSKCGSTGAALFTARDVAGDVAVLKLHGVAAPMVSAAKLRQARAARRGAAGLARSLALARCLTPLAAECGLRAASVAEWVAPLRAVTPDTGERVDEPTAVLAERARGVSAELLMDKLPSQQLLRALGSVSHAAVRDAALLDLLFVQGDRHGENIFVSLDAADASDAAGGVRRLQLIDSRDSAANPWGLNSMLLPGSFYHERNRIGNGHMDNRSKALTTHRWPLLLLDYRCHVPGGAIGTAFPPQARVTAQRSARPRHRVC
jgi:hypothetical protein